MATAESGGGPVRCFLITPTGRARRWLRRYTGFTTCPLHPGEYSYHDAMVPGEPGVLTRSENDTISTDRFRDDDPRWPVACDCGFAFQDYDARQTFFVEVYACPDGREVTIHHSNLPGIDRAPPGAMWYADWFRDTWAGPDGRSLCVMTPGGEWLIDGPSRSGGRWTRTGTPPDVTASPSIIAGNYHGWLRNGVLEPC